MNDNNNMPLFSPELMEKVARLELRARMVAEGLLTGMHGSASRGFNVEFLEHREYYPGDDPRHVDWKVFAKSGRYYVKQHEEEKNLQVYIVADASASMDFGRSGAGDGSGKWKHGNLLAAALAYLFLKQGDSVGLIIAGAGGRPAIEPRTSRGHLYRILGALADTGPRGEAHIADSLRLLGEQSRRRCFAVVISDLLEDPGPVQDALRVIRGRGGEAVVFHVLSAAELDFPFTRASRFVDPESGRDLTSDPTAVRALYLKNLNQFLDNYRDFCLRIGIDFVPAPTSTAAEEILLGYLERRERSKRR
ncbi:MAG: DUF58 domain-containing protein [bacterium]